MTVTCPGCGWSAEVPEEKIPDGGVTATCRKCQVKFEVKKELKPVAEQPPIQPRPESSDTKSCPLCGEAILLVAKKCKHCNSMLDEVKEEPRPPAQVPSQTAASTEAEPEKMKMGDTTTSKERKPLSNLEKVLFAIFGFAIIGGISGNNSAAPVMLLLYIGVLVFRLRKMKAEYHPPEKVVTPSSNRRALILVAILGILMLIGIPIISKISREHPPSASPSITERVTVPSSPSVKESAPNSSVNEQINELQKQQEKVNQYRESYESATKSAEGYRKEREELERQGEKEKADFARKKRELLEENARYEAERARERKKIVEEYDQQQRDIQAEKNRQLREENERYQRQSR